MSDKVLVDGEVSLVNYADGETSLSNVLDGEGNVVINVGGGGLHYDHYSGSYTVVPSTSVQTLDTSDKVMDDDVTVQAVQQGSATTPATIITADPTISVSNGGLITAQVSKTQQITPTVVEGYVSAGTAGNVGVSGSNTEQLSVQGAQTLYPATVDQTIPTHKYTTGVQTFKAVTVSGLTADKVLQGNVIKIGDADDDDRIMSVTGTAQGGITPTGTKTITANGTGIDVYNYQYADVAVPNSYSASDEGKVVSNGALVAQTSDTVTANDTYDTTLINSLTVNVSGGGGFSADDIATRTGITGDVVLDTATVIKDSAFRYTQITSLTGNSVTTVEGSAVRNISTLTSLNLPNLTSMQSTGTSIFADNPALTSISFPKLTSLGSTYIFSNDTSLAVCDLGLIGSTKNYLFNNCPALRTLVLRKTDSICTTQWANANVFGGIYSNPTASTIYVPSALKSTYETATNWSVLKGMGVTFSAIEGSIYEL